MGRFLLRIALLLASFAAPAPAQEDLDPLTAELRAERVQLELPGREATKELREGRGFAPDGTSSDDDTSGGHLDRRTLRPPSSDRSTRAPGFSFDLDASGLVKYLGFALIVALIVLAFVVAASGIRARRNETGEAVPTLMAEETTAPDVSRREPSADEVERLASEGFFTEAIHLLLLRAIASLGRSSVVPRTFSATSRELLRRSKLAGESRDAFARLVREVERCHFGGAPATRDAFESCRVAYSVIESAEPR